MKLTIDFETRATVDLKKHGACVYAAHDQTDILCCAFKSDAGPVSVWLPGQHRARLGLLKSQLPLLTDQEAVDLINAADLIEAHNAGFERVIWERVATPRYGWPAIPLEKLRCSLAKCAYHALPLGLDNACAALGLAGKDRYGYALMLKMCKPARYLSSGQAVWNEDPAQILTLAKYCIQDVEQEHALSSLLPDLPPSELELWRLDQEINFRGIGVDFASASAVIGAVEEWTARLEAELKALTKGKVKTAKQVAQLGRYLKGLGCDIEKLTKAEVAHALKSATDPTIRRLLEIRQSLARSSVSKYEAILNRTDADGRVRGTLQYHGCSTGRWCIAEGSLVLVKAPRGEIKEKVIEEVSAVDLVWDGDSWVNHGGVVFSGEKGVIEWDGIRATPEHKVFVSDGSCVPLAVAKESKIRIYRGGSDPWAI